MRRYAEIHVDGVLRATASESPADPVDAPGEMWRDYRIFDEKGKYSSQHSAGDRLFEETVEWLRSSYSGKVEVKYKTEHTMPSTGELFRKLKEIDTNIKDGWCTPEKARTLAMLILAHKPKLCVEIGVWSGKSFLPIALAAQNVGGHAIGIDPYTAVASIQGQNAENAKWWSETVTPEIYEQMYQRVRGWMLAHDLPPSLIRKSSNDALFANEIYASIDFLHIDGNHGEQAYQDTMNYGSLVSHNGIVVLDDLTWDGGGVAKSAQWLLGNGFVELFRVNTEGNDWGVFQRC